MSENITKKTETTSSVYSPSEEEALLIEKWKKRFKQAKDFRKPYEDKWLRFFQLYRAYRSKTNYAYETNLMPPIAFEIVETVKPRLVGAKENIQILPRGKEDVGSPSIEAWESLIKYDLEILEWDDKKRKLINPALKYGDAFAKLSWIGGEDTDGDPYLEVVDNWLLYLDPKGTDPQVDTRYEIQQIFKTKEQILREEKQRTPIYKNLEYVENKKVDDPRKERYRINTLKMGQIDKGKADRGSELTEEKEKDETVELWEIYDHEEDRIITIANQEIIIRDDVNPYLKINQGRLFYKLSDIEEDWEMYSISHLEPVETTIHEIADNRNQAMDDIVYNLDPIKKKRKGSGIKNEDIKTEPGAIWELNRADDVITERPPEISRAWLEKDALLRKEIQSALALSEYATGLPKSSQEPIGKVELLLMQTNIRFSGMLRQMELFLTRLINNLIRLNEEFITQDKLYRLVGNDVSFKEFKLSDKKVKVDAKITITPKVEKTPDQRKAEVLELYKIFVAEDKPDPSDKQALIAWHKRKIALQKMILDEFDKQEYEDLIINKEIPRFEEEKMPEMSVPAPEEQPQMPPEAAPLISQETLPQTAPSPRLIKRIIKKIPLLNRVV